MSTQQNNESRYANGATPPAFSREEQAKRADLDKAAKAHMAANPGVGYVEAYKKVGGK